MMSLLAACRCARTWRALWLAALVLAGIGRSAGAHTTLPATLELTEIAEGTFSVTFRVPIAEGPPAAIFPMFPERCVPQEDPSETASTVEVLKRANIVCGAEGLRGGTIELAGLRLTIMDTVVRIAFLNGSVVSKILRPSAPSFQVPAGQQRADVAGYARMGVEHILGGIDHLLFVAALLLIVAGVRRLLAAITAFTVAHSITLALAALGIVRFSPAPVEAVIALSIIFVGVELARREKGIEGISYRRPWIVAFTFGLLHGFGFAGTLSEVGIPSGDIPMALLSFNLGVEAGQLAFIGVFLAVIASIRTLDLTWPRWARQLPAYAIGSCASFWFLQRCALTFGF